MPTMLRTSAKARKIALKILGKPMNYETQAQKIRSKEKSHLLIREDLMRQR